MMSEWEPLRTRDGRHTLCYNDTVNKTEPHYKPSPTKYYCPGLYVNLHMNDISNNSHMIRNKSHTIQIMLYMNDIQHQSHDTMQLQTNTTV